MILWKYELERKQSPTISEATPHKNKKQATCMKLHVYGKIDMQIIK